MKFIHYGSNTINKNFKYDESEWEINRCKTVNKPIGGLWSCPINALESWIGFIRYNGPIQGKDMKKHVMFRLKPNSKVLILNSKNSLKKAFRKYGYVYEMEYFEEKIQQKKFDWEKIKKDYDAVYVEVSSLGLNKINGLVDEYNLRCWDVDSMCVWNLKKVRAN